MQYPRATRWARNLVMAKTAISMMTHNTLRLVATMSGVLFAVLLTNFAMGTFLGLIQKNTLLTRNMAGDIWIVPKGMTQFGTGGPIPMGAVNQARAEQGVVEAVPMLMGMRMIDALQGNREAVQVIGVPAPYTLGGPWNIALGSAEMLARPDTMLFEGSYRKQYGNLNEGDVREIAGHRVSVGGFTWGLLPFGAAYSFADYDLARELLKVDRDQATFGLIKVTSPELAPAIKSRLQEKLPEVDVLTRSELEGNLISFLLTASPIGVTFGAITFFGLLVGTVIVSLTMFQSVVDNIKEFGTLKAIGANMYDLAALLTVQALINAWVGTVLGVSLVAFVGNALKSPKLALQLVPQLTFATFVAMTFVCLFAALLALLRLRKVEPAMVFR